MTHPDDILVHVEDARNKLLEAIEETGALSNDVASGILDASHIRPVSALLCEVLANLGQAERYLRENSAEAEQGTQSDRRADAPSEGHPGLRLLT